MADAIEKLEYLTAADAFGTVERGDPLPYKLPTEKLREVGLVRETWKLEVVAEEQAKLDHPMTKEAGTALDFNGLTKLAEKHSVRFLKVMTCNNGSNLLGMGLWEGVPLRDVIWMSKPVESNIRRVYYYGYHNDDPKQMFRSSLPLSRVLEDPPGENPVILCYKLNGEFLSGKRGGPVRMLVPEAYGFKSVKWLQRIVLTNAPFANDTYADGNNDVDSWMKSFARFISYPTKIKSGMPIPLTGLAQVGVSGVTKVQYWLHPDNSPLPTDDGRFANAPWHDAQILAPPKQWGSAVPGGKLPTGGLPRQFNSATGKPQQWPMRYTIAHWAALVKNVMPGKYQLRCRTIDANGVAQPMPRPFPKSGRNNIQQVTVEVEA